MYVHRALSFALLISLVILSFSALAAAQEEANPPKPAEPPAAIEPLVLPIEPAPAHPEAAATAHAAPHGEAAAAHGGGHGGQSEHWTLFSLIPMEWTYDVAVKVGSLVGIPAEKIDRNMYNSHRLLHVMIFFFVLVLITIFSVSIGGQYKKMLASGEAAPQPGVTGMNFFEAIVKTVLGMMEEIIGGHDSKKYLPLIGTAAVVILFSNLLGLIPGFYTASDNWNTTLAMALTIFVMYHYYGIKAHGAGKYLAHFMGPLEGKIKYIMAPLMVPIELISHFARPLSLSLRLFGNMFGDHRVFAVFMGLVAIPLVYPLPFLALGLLVAIVQTLVFCLLSMVYIGLATAKEH